MTSSGARLDSESDAIAMCREAVRLPEVGADLECSFLPAASSCPTTRCGLPQVRAGHIGVARHEVLIESARAAYHLRVPGHAKRASAASSEARSLAAECQQVQTC